jgi:AraC-like DNA-binding protein
MVSSTDPACWTTSGGEPDELSRQWQEMLSATHLPWRVGVTDEDTPFTAWIRRRRLDDLALLDCACGPCSGTRQRRQIADTDGEYLALLVTVAGRETVTQGGAVAELRPGDAVAWVSTAPARFRVWTPLVKRSLMVPRAALAEVVGPAWPGAGVHLDGAAPATRLLTSYLDSLTDTLPGLAPVAVVAARNAALELLAAALATSAAPPAGTAAYGTTVPATAVTWPALRAAMHRYIERHLIDDALTPGALARAHGISVRTVNRVFHADGQTVGEVVRLRRLAHAREELVTGKRSISELAHRWGFADGSHFSRSFRSRYGWSPRDYRQEARRRRPGAPGPDGGALVQADGAAPPEAGPVPQRG